MCLTPSVRLLARREGHRPKALTKKKKKKGEKKGTHNFAVQCRASLVNNKYITRLHY